MSNSRSRIPSPARSMPLTPRRRETPRKARSVCSPARSNASCRLSSIVREHREQCIGSFGLSPMSRRSVLNDNTDIDVPGRQSWWKELGDNSQDIMDVLKDNNPEPHNIFDNIEVLSQEEKHHTINFDKIDSSDSESIRSIIIPQRKLFHEKENQPHKKIQPFGTRETLEKLNKISTPNVDKNISVATVKNDLFKNHPPSKPVFPAGLLNISSNSTASEKTMTIVEPKLRAHNLFNKQQNVNKSQALKRKNMFNKFIESDSEEELPEIQPKYFAFQRKTDSKRPSLASRGLDVTLTSSMDIEMDDWQLLPSSTMVDHQLNTTLTAGPKQTRLRLSKLSEAETGTCSSNTSQTKSMKNTSQVQEKSPQQNASIVTRNKSKTLNNSDEEMSQSKSPSSPNASQTTRLTRSKNKSQNDSINKSRNSNKSKSASKVSIKPTDVDKNRVNQSATKDSVVQNMDIDNKSPESKLKVAADNEDDELNFSLQYDEDNIDESDEENVAKNASVIDNSNKKNYTATNVTHTDSEANKTKNISPTDKDAQNIEKKVIVESSDIPDNKSHTATQNANKSNVLDPLAVEDKVNEIQKSPSKIIETEYEGNKEFEEQNQEVAQENIIDKRTSIETHQLENKDKQNEIREDKESHELHNDIQEKHIENQEEHNEYQEKLNKSERDQNHSQGQQKQSQQEESKSPEFQIGDQQMLNKSKEVLNEIHNKQNKSLNIQDENQKIPNDTEEVQHEIHDKQNENINIQDKNPETPNDTKEVQNEIHDKQDESLNIQDENQEIPNDTKGVQNDIHDEQDESLNIQDESQEIPSDSEEEKDESEEESNESEEESNESEEEDNEIEEENDESEEENNEIEEINNESEEEIEVEQGIAQKEIEQSESKVEQPEIENEDANDSVNAAAESDQNNTQDSEMECEDANESKNATAEDDQNDSDNEAANESLEAVADSDHDDNSENEIEEENDSESEAVNESLEATADSDHENNDTEDEDINKSLEATEESDQNEDQQNESGHEDDQIENTETPNVSHDTTGRNRKKSTPEAVLRNSRSEIELTTVRGRNTSARKTKSLLRHINKPSLEPARESMESIGAGNSSAEGSGWDSHRTTRKTLRQTFGKDFTPRKSLRALVMEKSAKRRATAINDTVAQARPLANSTEFLKPDVSADDYEMDNDPPVQEVTMRTRQMMLEKCLKVGNKEWAEMHAKAKAIVKQRLEQNNRKPRDDPFKVPATPWFARRTAKPVEKTKKRLKPLMSLENMPDEFMEDMKYKPPKRFAPSNASWLTKRLYKFLETKLEPKYSYKARVRAEKFAQMLHEFVQSLRRRGAPAVAAPHAVDALKREMARLNFVRTHYDFYNFFHDYMPREIRVKVNPDIINKIPHPKGGIFSDIL